MKRGPGNIDERPSWCHITIEPPSKNPSRIKEGGITKKCLEWVNTLPTTYCYKRKAGPGRKGEPDISGASHGIRIEIEMKAPGNKPTDLQKHKLKVWATVGCICGWVDSLESFKSLVKEGLEAHGIFIPERHFA